MDKKTPQLITPGRVSEQTLGVAPKPAAAVQRATPSNEGTTYIQAAVQQRFAVAYARPRDEDTVRAKILKDCQRPSFAAGAMYSVPRGGTKIEGLSIRFTEAAVRAMGNIWCEAFSVDDTAAQRVVRVQVSDLETNVSYFRDIIIEKIVERSKPDSRGGYVSMRTNSQGRVTYLVKASDDDLTIKENALTSKVLRTLILRMVPGWLQDESIERIKETRRKEHAQDPDTARRKLLDAFMELRISPKQMVEYLGHDVDVCTADEMLELRGLHSALKDQEINWPSAMAARMKAQAPSAKSSDSE